MTSLATFPATAGLDRPAFEARANELLDVLALAPVANEFPGDERTFFNARNEQREGRLFGGQVIAQCLRAATHTVAAERMAHSMHAYFLRGGRPDVPIRLSVERLRDGGSFSVRRVDAIQERKVICTIDASYHRHETGVAHEEPMPDVPSPETVAERPPLPPEPTDSPWRDRPRPFFTLPVFERRSGRAPEDRLWDPVWIKFAGTPPKDEATARCVLAYASDMGIVSMGALPHENLDRANIQMASLDHALWIHRPIHLDDWLLFVKRAMNAEGGRSLNRAAFYDRNGNLVASCAQEGLMRPVVSG